MPTSPQRNGDFTISEFKEFAGFPPQSQRYIKRSIDVALSTVDAEAIWARDNTEKSAIRAQRKLYEKLPKLRTTMPTQFDFNEVESFMGGLITVSAFDLGQGKLTCFSSYRFLYERLLGASVRQWLPSSFCAAAGLPHLHPNNRKTLLQSISESAATATGWSSREPTFFPKWVEKVQ